jgi:hypothetical protein
MSARHVRRLETNLKKGTSTSITSGCPNAAASGGGTIVANFKNLDQITAEITWKGGKGTTRSKVKQGAGPKNNKCKTTNRRKDRLIVSTGTYTGGTGTAGKALKGLRCAQQLCVCGDSSTYLLPGSKITVG